jgi:bacteriocin biosynthesis cyclodehydratase domain-containing protein
MENSVADLIGITAARASDQQIRNNLIGTPMQTEQRPAIPEFISVVPHGNNIVEFRKGTWHSASTFLTDESETGNLYRICSALDGSKTIRDVAGVTHLPTETISEVVDTLVSLELAVIDRRGLLRLGASLLVGVSEDISLKHKEVVVIGDAHIAGIVVEALSAVLGEFGANVSFDRKEVIPKCRASGASYDALERADLLLSSQWMQNKFVIYCNSHVDPITCKGLNLCFIHHKTPWLYAAVDGPFLLVGPLFVPGDSSCFECFETRVAMNLRDSKGYIEYKQALAAGLPIQPRPSQVLKLLDKVLASHVAMEAFNFALSGRSTLIDKMLAIHLPSMEFTYHEVLRLPYCSACGAKPDRDGSELYFSIKELFGPKTTL